MNVACTQCKTIFRVDPRKVPADGTRARCSVCGGVFDVVADDDRLKSSAEAATAPAAPAVKLEVSGPASAVAQPTAPRATKEEMEPLDFEGGTLGGSSAAAQPPSVAQEPAVARGPEAGAPDTFGQPGPGARVRRLARALISDLAVYNPERQEMGLREGRLKELFRDELKRSWGEYVEQVGLETAKTTPHFRDALNEILAKGKNVF